MNTSSGTILPRHIAIVMDGNGRWARARHMPRPAGHQQGIDATRRIVRGCIERGVEVLTLFAFSSENWRRPKTEVSKLMELFCATLRREVDVLASHGVQLRFIGDRGAFSSELRRLIDMAEEETSGRCKLLLNIAANYGGRWDITQAVRKIVDEYAAAYPEPTKVTAEAIASRLVTAGVPEPDLFIRTGGEHRISNFLLWQLAYTELYFTDIFWPDFDEAALDSALEYYAGRQRRYGKTGEQLKPARNA